MGSPPAPHLANGWLSNKDDSIKGNAQLFARYMDDIIREIKRAEIEKKLEEINNLHENLKFTIEREEKGTLPFLDMLIIHEKNKLSSTWYNKPTDTGLIMNLHALAPKRYKRSVVSGFVYRIHRACSSWRYFHESLGKAKRVLEHNQYPPNLYEPIIKETLESIIRKEHHSMERLDHSKESERKFTKIPIIVQYRGKCTEDYARALHKVEAPCTIVMTLRKLKTVLPSLKPSVEKMFKSGVVYKLTCPRCNACYVGQTSRHLQSRFKEHKRGGPMKLHLNECNVNITDENVDILQTTSRGESHLLTLEALNIREIKPSINTKDEYRSRELTIKL